ncbi:vacuolar protein-sorting-associated protein 36-like isoform X2 [Cherax quadricarinatus]|uniref:vacuolar protein-sorting-associated protein 36-like isoform X2 n=1 Tax=Cherax quadricarinatus TaxID=27406 RepID=UPI002379D00F|nr:myb-like protein K isoform X2 [Cherax quadricarinatus]
MDVNDISGEMPEEADIFGVYDKNLHFPDKELNSLLDSWLSESEDKMFVQNQDQGVQRPSESIQTPDISVQQPSGSIQTPNISVQQHLFSQIPYQSGVLDQTPGLNVQQTLGKSVQQTPQSVQQQNPQSVQQIPQSVQQIPQSVQQIPQSVQQIPQSVQQIPQSVQQIPQSVQQTSGKSVEHQSSQYHQTPGRQSVISRTATHPVGNYNTGNSVLLILPPQQTLDNVPHIPAAQNSDKHLQNNLLQSETPTQKQTNTRIVVSYNIEGVQNRYAMEVKPETGTSHMEKDSAISHNGKDISGPTSSSHNHSKHTDCGVLGAR